MKVVVDWRFILVGMPGDYEPCGRGRIILNILQEELTESCKTALKECLDTAIYSLFGSNITLMGLKINPFEKAPEFDVIPKMRVFKMLFSLEEWSVVSELMSQALREFYPNQIRDAEQSYYAKQAKRQISASQSVA